MLQTAQKKSTNPKIFSAVAIGTVMFFASYSSAISMKEIKKYQHDLEKACPPEAECDDGKAMVQPSAVEIEKFLGVKGKCSSGGMAMCSTKSDKQCKKTGFGEECVKPPECFVISHGVGKDTCGTKPKGMSCFDGEKFIWWNDYEETPEGVLMISESECLYRVPLKEKKKVDGIHFNCREGSCKTIDNVIVFVHFGCFEGACTADAMELYLKDK